MISICTCGQKPRMHDNKNMPDGVPSRWRFAVVCDHCKRDGEFAETEQEAIEFWNRDIAADKPVDLHSYIGQWMLVGFNGKPVAALEINEVQVRKYNVMLKNDAFNYHRGLVGAELYPTEEEAVKALGVYRGET